MRGRCLRDKTHARGHDMRKTMKIAILMTLLMALVVSLAGGSPAIADDEPYEDIPMRPGIPEPHDVFRLYNPNTGEHFYTVDTAERDNVLAAGWNDEGVGWKDTAIGIPVFRLYNEFGGEHHYTTSLTEQVALIATGWKDEGHGFTSAETNDKPVYRQYNPNAFANNHNYTANAFERDTLLRLGWKDEGIAWYSGE